MLKLIVGEKGTGKEGAQAQAQRSLPLRQMEGRRQPPPQIQGVLRQRRKMRETHGIC